MVLDDRPPGHLEYPVRTPVPGPTGTGGEGPVPTVPVAFRLT